MSYVIHALKFVAVALAGLILIRSMQTGTEYFNEPAASLFTNPRFIGTTAYTVVIGSPSDRSPHEYAETLGLLAYRARERGKNVQFDTTPLNQADAKVMREVAAKLKAEVK